MSPSDGIIGQALPRRARFHAALVGGGLLSALLLAGMLRPDPRGWGTHEQLGLPRCTLLALSGWRCPACGMTTSWSYLAQGQFAAAVRTHATGTLLALAAVVAGLGCLIVAACGRRLSWLPSQATCAVLVVILAGCLLVEWMIRLRSA